uniref:NADH-ubiquinone oxidoreductase chain 2 n=1 Tax=Paphia euglypta TaxID=345428 RepID=E2DYV9_9BIVA|nr:NADH dehydrogenase subunit 2 [Paphia euglypta]ADB03048.1 NADH dehydrogenase subunit 2 [Paphia euglypta]
MFGVMGSLSGVVSFLFSLIGVVVGFISVSMLGVWVGMELSFLSVICFGSGSSTEETESMMKYFIIQVMGSCVCAMGFLMVVNMFEIMLGQFLIMIGMIMKLGVFPFHFWVGPVVSKLSWGGCVAILLLQKLIPLWVFSNYILFFKDVNRIEFLCCMTSLVGCLGGLNVLNYRVLLGFSSVQNLGSMVLLSCCHEFYLWMFIVVYFILSGFLMMSLWVLGVYGFQDLVKEKSPKSFDNFWWVSLYFLSSAGIPPFVGCAMKVALIYGCWNYMPLGTGFCVLTSCISLVFYLGVILSVVIFWGKSSSLSKVYYGFSNSKVSVLSLLVNLAGGFLIYLVLSL